MIPRTAARAGTSTCPAQRSRCANPAPRRLRPRPASPTGGAPGRGTARTAERTSRPRSDLPRACGAPQRHGHDVTRRLSYGLDRLACGLPRDNVVRALYREAVVRARTRRSRAAGSVRSRDGRSVPRLAAEPVVRSADGFEVSRYLYEVYRGRGDLQGLFPRSASRPGRSSNGPTATAAASSVSLPRCCRRVDRLAPPATASTQRDGVNVAGYFRSEFGVGEAARLLVDGLDAAGSRMSRHVYASADPPRARRSKTAGRAPLRHEHRLRQRRSASSSSRRRGSGFFDRRHTVGYWWWEAGVLPEHLRPALDVVDEVWVGSEYVRSLIAPVTDEAGADDARAHPGARAREPHRARNSGCPDGFLFLFVFDFFSIIERKNPLGLIEAYRQAFGPRDGARSCSRASTATSTPRGARAAARRGGRPARHRHPRPLRLGRERSGMMTACDCYVSLHRSEGLGLTMAEAMALGKPVIATGWSGNLEFMSDETAYLVRHEMTRLERDARPVSGRRGVGGARSRSRSRADARRL